MHSINLKSCDEAQDNEKTEETFYDQHRPDKNFIRRKIFLSVIKKKNMRFA